MRISAVSSLQILHCSNVAAASNFFSSGVILSRLGCQCGLSLSNFSSFTSHRIFLLVELVLANAVLNVHYDLASLGLESKSIFY